MKKLFLLVAFVCGFAMINVNAQTIKDAPNAVETLAQQAAEADENIVAKTCEKSGTTSYYKKSVCEKSGKVSMTAVSYDQSKGAFVAATAGKSCSKSKAACSKDKKACSKDKKACAKDKKACAKDKKACSKDKAVKTAAKSKKSCCSKDKKACSKSKAKSTKTK